MITHGHGHPAVRTTPLPLPSRSVTASQSTRDDAPLKFEDPANAGALPRGKCRVSPPRMSLVMPPQWSLAECTWPASRLYSSAWRMPGLWTGPPQASWG